MTVTQAIRERRSIRRYKKDGQVTEEQLHSLLEAAMCAPSARNSRPWEFVVIQSEEGKRAFAAAHPFARHLESASVGIVICGRPDLQKGVSAAFWPQDCGAAAENILLQACDLGLGGCWCGIYPKDRLVEEIKALLNTEATPFCLITIGVPDEQPGAKGFYDPDRVRYI